MSTSSTPPGPEDPVRDRRQPGRSSGTGTIWIVVGVLLAVGIIVPILVGTYDSETPELGGVPFFYWYQFLLIPVVSILTYIAFKLAETGTERDREARGLTRRQP
jgi:hypothetical protein